MKLNLTEEQEKIIATCLATTVEEVKESTVEEIIVALTLLIYAIVATR